MGRSGFTLLEMALATFISGILVAATFVFYAPSAMIARGLQSSDALRAKLSGPMDFLEREVSGMRTIYVDATKCYAFCMVDNSSNRIYYYWGTGANASTLYRKQEPTTAAISCTGGKVWLDSVDKTKTTFGSTDSSLQVTLAAKGTDGKSYQLTNRIFPSLNERSTIFTEGFECATLAAGWTVNTGSRSTWSIEASGHVGQYDITDTDSGSGTDTTTVEIPVDLNRLSSAHLKFSYMNAGSIAAPDSFIVYVYDGTVWQTVFSDTSGALISSLTTVEVDLTPYQFNDFNKIRFAATLNHAGDHWYLDQISVFTP